jgi:hypothetical protein
MSGLYQTSRTCTVIRKWRGFDNRSTIRFSTTCMHAESGAPWPESFWYFMLCSIRLTFLGAELPYKSERILALGPPELKRLFPGVTIESFIIDGEHLWYHESMSKVLLE